MIGKALKRQVTEVREGVLCQGLTTGYAPELSMLPPELPPGTPVRNSAQFRMKLFLPMQS